MTPPPPRSTLFPYTTLFRSQVWVPLSTQPLVEPDLDPKVSMFAAANRWWLILIGRLKPGFSAEQAAAGLNVIFRPDRKSTRLNSSHGYISYAVFCLKKKKKI